jgi:hypothetical protein
VIERLAPLFGRLYVDLEVLPMVGLTDEVSEALGAEQPIETRIFGRLRRIDLALGLQADGSDLCRGFTGSHPCL